MLLSLLPKRGWLACAGALALAASACGANNAASQIRDQNPNATDVMSDDRNGGSCTGVDEPLIVDADESQRGNLEVAMKSGIAVVAYDCKKIRLLTGCKAEGSYSYSGFTTKEKTMRLANADAIRANLPLSGASLAGKLEAEMTKGLTLDIALVMTGKKTSTTVVTGDMIKGQASECKDATHFVRAAMIGAFAMKTGSSASAKAEVDTFFAKGGAASSSSLDVDKKDGLLEDCRKADPNDSSPRKQCGGLIRLELVVIGQHGPLGGDAPPDGQGGDSKAPEAGADVHTCPRGMAWTGDHCDLAAKVQSHACKEGDVPDCTAQCDKGNADSCNTLGVYWQKGDYARRSADGKSDPVKPDTQKAEKLFLMACEKGVASACSNAAGLYRWGAGFGDNKVAKDDEKLRKYAQVACNAGDGRGCSLLGGSYFASSKEDERAKSGPLFVRACNSYAQACADLGTKLNSTSEREKFGKAFLQGQQAGIVFLSKACKGGLSHSCASTGDAYAGGLGTEKDGLKALELYSIACERGNATGCYRAGHLYEFGGLNKDEKKAADFYKKACETKTPDGKPAYGSERGCMYLGRLHERGAGVPKDEVLAASLYKKSCDTDEKNQSGDGCFDLARIYDKGLGVPKNPGRATEILAFGCKGWGNFAALSCNVLAPRYLSGQNLPKDEKKDEKKAVEMYRRSCWSSPEACLALATLATQGKGGLAKDDKSIASFYLFGCSAASNHDVDVTSPGPIAQACVKLAAAEVAGKGRDKDPVKAADHYGRACARGDQAACAQAKKLAPPPAK